MKRIMYRIYNDIGIPLYDTGLLIQARQTTFMFGGHFNPVIKTQNTALELVVNRRAA